uniref:Uncharacterized protein n=1 Tax=Astatotilapia calliptera TaxID=8154 RepID=A0AAX7VAR7_ASTCA
MTNVSLQDFRTYWAEMASYFDEHNCEPTDPEEQYRQNALLEMARYLIQGLDWIDARYAGMSSWDQRLPPPAAKTAVQTLTVIVITAEQAEVSSVLCVCWSLRSSKRLEKCLANTFSTQDVYCHGWTRPTPVRSADLNYPLIMQTTSSLKKTRREGNRASIGWRACMEPCTHDAAVLLGKVVAR